MSADTAIQCQCCEEAIYGRLWESDGIGLVCHECAMNMIDNEMMLRRKGIEGIYMGRCPDNRKDQP